MGTDLRTWTRPLKGKAMSDINYEQYNGKKVLVTVNQADGTAAEVEGTVEIGTAAGLLIKPKGKTKLDLIESANIAEVKLAPETAKAITAKKLKPIVLGQARGHLLERHGYKLKDINAMNEDTAFDFHESIDHKSEDLGHVHEAATTAEVAVAEAEVAAS